MEGPGGDFEQISFVEALKLYRNEYWAFDYNREDGPFSKDTTLKTGTPYTFGEIVSDYSIWYSMSFLNNGKIVKNAPDYSRFAIQLQGEANRIFVINTVEMKVYYNNAFVANITGYGAEEHLIFVDMPLVTKEVINVYKPFHANFEKSTSLQSTILTFLEDSIFMLRPGEEDLQKAARIRFQVVQEFMIFRNKPLQSKVTTSQILEWVNSLLKKYPADRPNFQKELMSFTGSVEYNLNPKPLSFISGPFSGSGFSFI